MYTQQQKAFIAKAIRDAATEGLINSWIVFEEDFQKDSYELINRGYEALNSFVRKIPQFRNCPRLRMRIAEKAFELMLKLRACEEIGE